VRGERQIGIFQFRFPRYLRATRLLSALRKANRAFCDTATTRRATNKEGYEEGESGCCFVSDCVSALEREKERERERESEPLEKCIESDVRRASFPRSLSRYLRKHAASVREFPQVAKVEYRPLRNTLLALPACVPSTNRWSEPETKLESDFSSSVTFPRSRVYACRSRRTRRVHS